MNDYITINISKWSDIPDKFTGHVKHIDGTQEWYKDGRLYREDGPSVINADGSQYWYMNGEFHRENGPAIIEPPRESYWYLNGKEFTKDNYYKELYKRGKITELELFMELL